MHSLDLFSLKYEHILVKSDSICYYFLSRSSQKSYKRVNIIQKPWKAIVIKTSFQQLALKITYWKNFKSICNDRLSTAGKVSKCGVISGPYFPAFGLNMERYFVSLRVQSECRKIRTRNNSVFWTIFTQYQNAFSVWLDLIILNNIRFSMNKDFIRTVHFQVYIQILQQLFWR